MVKTFSSTLLTKQKVPDAGKKIQIFEGMAKTTTSPEVVIEQVPDGAPLPIHLLLEADPDESRVRNYISFSLVLAAITEGKIIGILAMTPETREKAEIRNLAVAATYRGKGIAQLLMQEACERAKRLGYSILQINTGNSSTRQLKIYQQFGFELSDIRWNYFVQHYPTKIVEDGIECRHQLVLTKNLC
ncbi:GNAT family N-acetyltransferase [Flavihumibacter solisilvae]|nr:GNAT family N-acetyltransferase [Flavihumibacter solisilvae]